MKFTLTKDPQRVVQTLTRIATLEQMTFNTYLAERRRSYLTAREKHFDNEFFKSFRGYTPGFEMYLEHVYGRACKHAIELAQKKNQSYIHYPLHWKELYRVSRSDHFDEIIKALVEVMVFKPEKWHNDPVKFDYSKHPLKQIRTMYKKFNTRKINRIYLNLHMLQFLLDCYKKTPHLLTLTDEDIYPIEAFPVTGIDIEALLGFSLKPHDNPKK